MSSIHLSEDAIKAAKWLRDNQHHYVSWEPQTNYPKDVTHMHLRGFKAETNIDVEVWDELNNLLDHGKEQTVFYPKPELLEYLRTV